MADKINRILIVVFLTLLIWTWAYMLQEKEATFTGTLRLSPAADPGLLVTFSITGSLPQTEIPLSPIVFKGAPSRISDLQKQFREEQLEFFYNPQELGHEEGPFRLDMREFLQNNDQTQDMALTLLSCIPPQVDVNIERLESKKISVICVDENGMPVPDAVPDPALVNVYVRKEFNGSATATLTKQQINLAREQAVSVQPYVNLGVARMTRDAQEKVNITIPSEELLTAQSFQPNKKVGVLMSQELQNKYKVTILDEDKLENTLRILATDQALEAFKKVEYPRYIMINDTDVLDVSKERLKDIYYNFPDEYIRTGEISIDRDLMVQESVKITIEERVNGN